MTCKDINRPSICHFSHEVLPIIDEHNRLRQKMLGLERKWLTKDLWFRLMTTVTGSYGVDACRWCRSIEFKEISNALLRRRKIETNNFEAEHDYEIEVTKFTDMLRKSLDDDVRKKYTPRLSHINTRKVYGEVFLERITGPYGRNDHPVTAKQRESGRRAGIDVNQKCHICRKFLKQDVSANHAQTCFCSSTCKIPLCRENKVDPEAGRRMICLEEHAHYDEMSLCYIDFIHCEHFLTDEMINLHPRRSSKKRRKRR